MTAPGRARIPLFLLLLTALAAGCASGPPPLLEGSRALGPTLLVFGPEVRLGGQDGRVGEDMMHGRLDRLLRQSLAGRGLELAAPGAVGDDSALRTALIEILVRQKQRNRRLRPGDPTGVRGELAEAQSAQASSVAVAMLSRSGIPRGDDDTFLPVPPDQIVPLPEERSDYEIPRADATARPESVDLDLLVVDATTGEVRLHRRVTYPASNTGEIDTALPVLVREVSRGVTR